MFCPYCGEELPDETPTCTRCGSALAAGAEALPPEALEEHHQLGADPTEAPAENRPRKKVRTVDCPNCGAPQPETRHRCGECGQALARLVDETVEESRKFRRLASLLGVAGVGMLFLLIFLIAGLTSRPPLPKKRPATGKSAKDLWEALSNEALSNDRKRRLWEKVRGRYVTWSGRIEKKEGHTLWVDVGSKEPIRVRVEVDDRRTPTIRGETGDPVTFFARLAAYGREGDDVAFELDDGEIRTP